MSARFHQETLVVGTRSNTSSKGRHAFVDVTDEVARVVSRSGATRSLCTIFIQHTSASLVIQENADPRVLDDLDQWMARVAPESAVYSHDDEGPDDMPGHLRAAITKTSETVPITAGRLGLGTWQAIYLWEHRAGPHQRRLVVTIMGES